MPGKMPTECWNSATIAAPVGVINSKGTDICEIGIPFNISRAAGEGSGYCP